MSTVSVPLMIERNTESVIGYADSVWKEFLKSRALLSADADGWRVEEPELELQLFFSCVDSSSALAWS